MINMPSDNEVMVLIYETVQKQLGQIKDSRVVMQTLTNRVGELSRTIDAISARTDDISSRLESLEKTVHSLDLNSSRALKSVNSSNTQLKDTVNAMRQTIDNVTNPSVTLISRNSRELKDTVRDMRSVHSSVMDEFEQYEIRLVKLEDSIDKMLKNQLLKAESRQVSETAFEPERKDDE